MDEMEEYRERIERRYGDRRLKNDRRTKKKVKFWDAGTVVNGVLLTIAAVVLYYVERLFGGNNG